MKRVFTLNTNKDDYLTCKFHPAPKKTNYIRMKTFPTFLLLSIFVLFISTAWEPAKTNPFVGSFRLIKATTNSQPNPEQTMDRSMIFSIENTFSGQINVPTSGLMPYNQGVYIVENETQILMQHTQPTTNALSSIAYVYNYNFFGGTLRLRGFYLAQSIDLPSFMQKMFIDEWWVKSNPIKANPYNFQ
jgi:hypothetical protein